MFWQAAVPVATLRKPLFVKQMHRDWEHFLPHPAFSCPSRATNIVAKSD